MNQPRKLKIVGVIPARLGSTRLPRKVLREIQGKILIEQVYRRAVGSSLLDELWIATDSQEVLEACRQRKIPALMTSPNHASGTDRIYEVVTQKLADVYVNIQGDEPLVRPEHLEALLSPFSSKKEIQVSTLKTKISREAAESPNVVKVVTDSKGWALYFSRSAIPYLRDGGAGSPRPGAVPAPGRGAETAPLQRDFVYKHLGFYAYTRAALEKFHQLPPSSLEQSEKLEQLRFLENGIPIFVAETPFNTLGVDTEEDLQRAAALLFDAP